ncbi:thermonuclease family protein [Candidatus Woesebacteria bacterium]|nr:thermonuclease family protein [Candidatus Woesebacteria bacterium]
MSGLFVLLFLLSSISIFIFLIKPSLLTKWFRLNFSRKKIVVFFGGLSLLFMILTGMTAPAVEKSSYIEATPQESIILENSQNATDEAMQAEIKTKEEELFLVTRIVDGDTIELEDGEKVRYIGIDTPEKSDCYSQEATSKNEELVLNKKVKLVKDVSNTDRYDRLLRYVYIDDIFINQVLVAGGYAHASSYPPDAVHQDEFKEAERKARVEQNGLWGEICNPKPTPTPTILPSPRSTPTAAPVYVPKPKPTTAPVKSAPIVAPTTTDSYSCNCKKTCTQMSSCDEAYYQLNTCGCSVRDGDDDGVPCETICPGG